MLNTHTHTHAHAHEYIYKSPSISRRAKGSDTWSPMWSSAAGTSEFSNATRALLAYLAVLVARLSSGISTYFLRNTYMYLYMYEHAHTHTHTHTHHFSKLDAPTNTHTHTHNLSACSLRSGLWTRGKACMRCFRKHCWCFRDSSTICRHLFVQRRSAAETVSVVRDLCFRAVW